MLQGILFLLFSLQGVSMIFFNLRNYPKIYASRNWPETVGKINQARTRTRGTFAKSQSNYWAEFIFTFTASGSELTGMLRFTNRLGLESIAEKDVSEHPVGSTFWMRYDPESPLDYVTEFDKKTDPILWVFSIIFIIFSIIILFLPS